MNKHIVTIFSVLLVSSMCIASGWQSGIGISSKGLSITVVEYSNHNGLGFNIDIDGVSEGLATLGLTYEVEPIKCTVGLGSYMQKMTAQDIPDTYTALISGIGIQYQVSEKIGVSADIKYFWGFLNPESDQTLPKTKNGILFGITVNLSWFGDSRIKAEKKNLLRQSIVRDNSWLDDEIKLNIIEGYSDDLLDRIDRVLKLKNNLDQNTLEAALERLVQGYDIWIGMERDILIAIHGKPKDINRTVTRYGVDEQFVYSSFYAYVENGKVTAWQN